MADLVTRILLNSTQFDNNIAKSCKEVQKFNEVSKNVTGVIGKFAGMIGLSMGAMEAFNKYIDSGAETQKAFKLAISASKDTVDLFFQSLNTGNFAAFNKGITGAINNMLELEKIRASYNKTKNSTDVLRSEYNYNAQRYKAIINDPHSSKAQVAAAKSQLLKITKDFTTQLEGQNTINKKELVQNARSKTGRYYTANDMNAFATVYNNPASKDPRKKAYDAYNKKMDKLENQLYTYNQVGTNYGTVTTKSVNQRVAAEIAKLKKQNNEFDRMRILSKQDSKQRNEYYNSLKEYYDTKEEAEQNYNFAIKQEKRADKILKGKKKDKPVSPAGSIAEIDSELASWNKKLNEATTNALRRSAQKMIDELEAKKIKLTFDAKYGDMKNVKQKMAGVLGDNTKGTDFSKISTQPLTDKITKKDIKINNEFAESLYVISNVMGNLSGTMSDSAQE